MQEYNPNLERLREEEHNRVKELLGWDDSKQRPGYKKVSYTTAKGEKVEGWMPENPEEILKKAQERDFKAALGMVDLKGAAAPLRETPLAQKKTEVREFPKLVKKPPEKEERKKVA